jgi:hypothetical protein
MKMIGLDSERKNCPAFLRPFLANQLLTPLFDLAHSHRFASPGTPDEMIDNEMDMGLIPLILKCLFHGLRIHYLKPEGKAKATHA